MKISVVRFFVFSLFVFLCLALGSGMAKEWRVNASGTGLTDEWEDSDYASDVADVATGVGVLGAIGALGYALSGAKAGGAAAAAAKAAGTASSKAATATAAETVVESISGPAEGPVSAEQANLPQAPQVGDTRTYTDANGTRWVEKYNGQNWVDNGTFDAMNDQVADNARWREEQWQKQINKDTAFDRQLEQRKIDHAKNLQDIHTRNMNQIRQNHRLIQDINEHLQAMNERSLSRVEKVNNVLDWGQGVADVSVPIIGTFTGPPGWVVGTAYTMVSNTGAGMATGIVDPSKGVVAETLKGVGRGAVNVLVGEGLNCATAIGAKAVSVTVKSIPKTLEPGFKGLRHAFSKTPFNSPVPVDDVAQMATNLKDGWRIDNRVNCEQAFSSVTNTVKNFFGKGSSATKSAGFELAKETWNTGLKGGYSAARGKIIDGEIAKSANSALWGE